MTYEEFEQKMAIEFPRYYGEDCHFGGFAIGEGWYQIISLLTHQIDAHTKWKRNTRAYQLRLNRARNKGRDAVLAFICKGKVPSMWEEERADSIMLSPLEITPYVPWVQVRQIKEKFGGLRFYYDGGDDTISGMVTMAEVWAGRVCETCGERGTQRSGGWIRTLCDKHEAEYQARAANMKDEDE